MDQKITFEVRYTEAMLRTAVRAFVFHRLGGAMLIGAFAVVGTGYAGYLIGFGRDGWFAGFVTAFVVVVIGFVGLLWFAHYRNTFSKFRRAKQPVSTFLLANEALTVSMDSGSGTLPWSTFTEILDCGSCWLLSMGANQFVTLPTDGVPPDALAFLREKIPKFTRIVR